MNKFEAVFIFNPDLANNILEQETSNIKTKLTNILKMIFAIKRGHYIQTNHHSFSKRG